MNEAMQRFTNYTLTDKGLMACLQYVNYGNQFVAKTPFACSKIEIVSETEISEAEKSAIRQYTDTKRTESRNVVDEMTVKYRREGKYLDEIITEAKHKERDQEMER